MDIPLGRDSMKQSYFMFFVAPLLYYNCFGELEILNSDGNKKTKSQKNAAIACAIAQSSDYSSCNPDTSRTSYCSTLYNQCTLACALTQLAFSIGCGL